jgi:hypothetical protein
MQARLAMDMCIVSMNLALRIASVALRENIRPTPKKNDRLHLVKSKTQAGFCQARWKR